MRKVTFAVIGALSLALAACGGQQEETVEGAGENVEAEELNTLADNAAMEAAENDALGTETEEPEETIENETGENPTDPANVEEDVQGM